MYALRNKVQLIGNLGKAPEVRPLAEGKKMARFSVATNEKYKNKNGESVTDTQWHNVVAWDNMAEIVERYLIKGTEVALEGKLVNRNYTDKDGIKRYVTEVVLSDIMVVGTNAAHLK